VLPKEIVPRVFADYSPRGLNRGGLRNLPLKFGRGGGVVALEFGRGIGVFGSHYRCEERLYAKSLPLDIIHHNRGFAEGKRLLLTVANPGE